VCNMSACLLSPVGVVCLPLSLFFSPSLFPSLSYSSFPSSPSSHPLPGASHTSFAIRPLLEYLNSFDHYADNILDYEPIRSHLDGVALQNYVNIIVSWIEPTGLKLNPIQTKLMVLTGRLHPVQPQIIVAGCDVAQATSLKYFGVTVSSKLS